MLHTHNLQEVGLEQKDNWGKGELAAYGIVMTAAKIAAEKKPQRLLIPDEIALILPCAVCCKRRTTTSALGDFHNSLTKCVTSLSNEDANQKLQLILGETVNWNEDDQMEIRQPCHNRWLKSAEVFDYNRRMMI
jgi:hypothetical protein